MEPFDVVAAIIIHDNKILCVQRGASKYVYLSNKYEFPGGKVEIGETHEEALIRELQEELRIDIIVLYPFLSVKHHYPDIKLTLHSFVCSCADPSLKLTEHTDFKWLSIEELPQLDWVKADEPIVVKLQTFEDL